MEHHQNGRGAEGPAPLAADADGRTGHLLAGTAVKAAHLGDAVVKKEALDQVAFSQQVAPLLRVKLRMLLHGSGKQRFQLQHLRDLPPVKHTPHQYQDRQRVLFQHLLRALPQNLQHQRRVKGRQ